MSSETNFETYLLINKKKFILCVIHNTSFETIYEDEMLLSDNSELKFEMLNEFLEKNIFKVEKILKNFVKDIDIILDNENFFSVKMSIKKNNNGKHIDSKSLLNPLNDLKNSCQSNFNDKKIAHMLIENYLIDDKNYFTLPKNIKCNFFSLDVNFICISNNFVNARKKKWIFGFAYHKSIVNGVGKAVAHKMFFIGKLNEFKPKCRCHFNIHINPSAFI